MCTNVYIPYRSLIEALYTLNSPPVVPFKNSLMSIWVNVHLLSGKGASLEAAVDEKP